MNDTRFGYDAIIRKNVGPWEDITDRPDAVQEGDLVAFIQSGTTLFCCKALYTEDMELYLEEIEIPQDIGSIKQ